MNRNVPVFRRLRSSATKEQLRRYFEVRFRAEKYGVPYFLAESEAIALRPTERGRRSKSAERGRGFKWRAPTRSVGRRPFKPQTVLLHRRLPVGSGWIWRSQTRGRRDRLGKRDEASADHSPFATLLTFLNLRNRWLNDLSFGKSPHGVRQI